MAIEGAAEQPTYKPGEIVWSTMVKMGVKGYGEVQVTWGNMGACREMVVSTGYRLECFRWQAQNRDSVGRLLENVGSF